MIQKLNIIGVQIDLGASKKGVDMGPSAIRHANITQNISKLGIKVHDCNDIIADIPEEEGNPRLKYADVINSANQKLYEKCISAFESGSFPLVLGGDHSIAAGSAVAAAEKAGPIGIIWIDAHGDFNNEESTLTGNMHGMPLSSICGRGPACMTAFSKAKIAPKNAVIIGARDLDPLEVERLRDAGVTVFSISDVHTLGMPEIISQAIRIACDGTNGFHFSFDMDALDPSEAPGVGTPVNNGLTLREAFIITEFVHRSEKMTSMDLVEVNPLLDIKNQTGILAVDLILSTLGSTNY